MMNDEKLDAMHSALERFYDVAEQYDEVEASEINPSLYALARVTQRYQKPELIAEGGMKEIYKVYDAHSKRYVAMALLKASAPDDLGDPFIHEAWLTALLDHPNIITIHDVGIKALGRPYFTMDLQKGHTLRELIEALHKNDRKVKVQYSEEELLRIFIKICDAMAYAHSAKVLHLDLKPANIEIGEFGEVLVCDWGMGKVLEGYDPQKLDRMLFSSDLLNSSNLHGQLKGTPGFMAPEQMVDDGDVDERTDVYGLGCILYSLLTLQRPFTGHTVDEILKRSREGEIIPPVERAPKLNIPESLNAVVLKALSVNPRMRYSSVEALRLEVSRYLGGFATEAEHAGVIRQFLLFYNRNLRFCLTVLSFALLLVIAVVAAFSIINDARRNAEQTLALYEAGQSELERMSYRSAESVVAISERYEFIGDYERAEAILAEALNNNPDNEIFLRGMGEHYFTAQKFRQALPFFEKGIHATDSVHQTAVAFAEVKPDDQPMTADQMCRLLVSIKAYEPLALRSVIFDQIFRFDLKERAQIIEAYLHVINPDWTDGWFEYDAENSSLRAGGEHLHRLSTQQSVITGINPRSLDISNSNISELWNEKGAACETLDIRNTAITDLWFLKRFLHLKTLIVTPGQFTEDQLGVLQEDVKTVELPL